MTDFAAVIPIVIVTLAACAAMVAEAFRGRDERMPIGGLGLIGLAGAGLASAFLWNRDAIGFGGNKMTGKNRELGAEGLEVFRKSKMVMIAPEAKADPEWFPYPDGDAYAG